MEYSVEENSNQILFHKREPLFEISVAAALRWLVVWTVEDTMAWKNDVDFGHKVAGLCCSHYSEVLGKSGKPQGNKEWTLMSAIVLSTEIPGKFLL